MLIRLTKSGAVTRVALLLIILMSVSGCAITTKYPEKFATLPEVYAEKPKAPAPDQPQGSYKKMVFQAPYNDVFRAVTVGATQAMLNVESNDKATGVITATMRSFVQGQGETVRFFIVNVKEVGPSVTEVELYAKEQAACNKLTVPWLIAGTICSFGLLLPVFIMANNACNEQATLHWGKAAQEMEQVLIMTKNNLIAAGAL